MLDSSTCSLHNTPLAPTLRLTLLRHHVVVFSWSTCDVVPNCETYHYNGSQRAPHFAAASLCGVAEVFIAMLSQLSMASYVHALAIVCVCFQSICTTFEIPSLCVVLCFHVLSFLHIILAEGFHMCKTTFLLHCVFCTSRIASFRR